MAKMPTNKQVHEKLRKAFQEEIPGGRTIATRAVKKCLRGHEHDPVWLKKNFSRLVERAQLSAYDDYKKAEARIGASALSSVFLPLVGRRSSPRVALNLVGKNYRALDRFFLGLRQGRRPRAGNAFEFLIRELFGHLEYPFTAQAVINGQPDFILPSIEHFRRDPPDCIIFTVKRTLRERWRQIVTEGTRGLGFFLGTIDEKIASRDLAELHKSRIRVVVPGRIKKCRKDYVRAVNVITFEDFFKHHLDPAMKRWRAARVL
jgi:hypothetical protein